MIETETDLRRWGKSLGLVIPKKEADRENLHEGERVKIIVMKSNNILRETFGTLKAKRPTKDLLREVDHELDIEV